MKFALGCNYWDSKHGTDMWKYYDEVVIRDDMKAISALGIKHLRVFPNWRDFQPVKRLYTWRMIPSDCVTADEEKFLPDKTGIDPKQIENFRSFASICAEYGISLTVSVLTGWMSGRMFVPPILDGVNLITDPLALVWTERYIRGFVSAVKDIENIVMWDLGNECNCLSQSPSREASYAWTAFVKNAIRAADPVRPIASGMHGLSAGEDPTWMIADQGELTDYMTTHPYVSPSINNDYDPANRMRSTIYPTVQSMYYRDLGGKPVIMQEQNTFTDTTADPEASADFARVNVLSCIAHDIEGHFWWCATEHSHLSTPPYSWSIMERSLGIVDGERKPKRIGRELKAISERIAALPFESLAPHEREAVCLISQNERWKNASVCYLLAKQAGFDCRFSIADSAGEYLPKSKLYLMPGIAKTAVLYKHVWDALWREIESGAVLLVTYDGGSLIELERLFGLRAHGNVRANTAHVAKFPFGELKYRVNQELLLESTGAEILARNEEGNIVFSRHKFGKGQVYFLNFPLEANLFTERNAFTDTDWYKIYRTAASEVLKDRLFVSNNPQICTTLHKVTDKKYIACAINYSDRVQKTEFVIKDGWKLKTIDGAFEELGKCDGAFYELVGESK